MCREITRLSVTRIAAALAATATIAAATALPAQASESIESFEVTTTTTQAGGHPDLETKFELGNHGTGNPGEAAEDAVSKCTSDDFALEQCPMDSQVGVVTVRANYGGDEQNLLGTAPVFDMASRSADETARLAFIAPVADIPINIPIRVRTERDYGLTMTVAGIPEVIPLAAADIRVWGFPASGLHDEERFVKGSPGNPAGCPDEATGACASSGGSNPHQSTLQLSPLTDNPTVCTGQPLTVKLDVTTYQDEGNPAHAEASYNPTTGCQDETFEPVFNAALTSERTDSASGLEMQMKAAQFLGLANSPSSLRTATLILPEGISINPDAADGQTACSDEQANFGDPGPAGCPDSSKIGNFDIVTPALDAPLTGSIYIGEPKPGNQYRAFLIASGFGINSKIVANITPDLNTGQLSMSVVDLPQVPFEQFNLHLFASDRGLVATPTRCAVYEADSLFVPWNDQLAPQHSTPQISVTHGPNDASCPSSIRPFHPSLVAGMSNAVAGDFSSFSLKLDRNDGDQFLGDLNFRLPPGFTGSLRGIGYCPEEAIAAAATRLGRAEQASPSCPASSQIGTSNVAAGPGTHPFHAVGRMYLAGPFKGAPLSLVAITPALAGPYDYGVVVVRVALQVNPLTAQVSAVSDRVPSIIGGVPIRMRSIQVNIDRPNFTINPTNCTPSSIDSQGIGDEGTVTEFSSYFHVVNCGTLPFKPKMRLRQVGGRKGTRRGRNPKLQIDLWTRPGDANVQSLAVTLPSAFEIDQRHLGNICSEKELASTRCAGRQPIGTATTRTPLLDQPLSGPVFAVSGSGGLPRLAFILNGQVTLIPRAEAKTVGKGQLQTIAPVIPDAPIGHFSMTVFGGKRGYLVNTRDLCAHVPITRVSFVGQNGATHAERMRLRTGCRGARKRRNRHELHGGGGR
jgi:hypothetical protein